jgi:hypothetical protein
MMDALLLVLVVGTMVLALGTDAAALLAWLRMHLRTTAR